MATMKQMVLFTNKIIKGKKLPHKEETDKNN